MFTYLCTNLADIVPQLIISTVLAVFIIGNAILGQWWPHKIQGNFLFSGISAEKLPGLFLIEFFNLRNGGKHADNNPISLSS
jgi:hypothetical protein